MFRISQFPIPGVQLQFNLSDALSKNPIILLSPVSQNDLRVSASRSRCRNLVGLNGLARVRPLEFSGQAPGHEIRVRQRLALLAAQRAQTRARDPG
jgi:hypothetical protein